MKGDTPEEWIPIVWLSVSAQTVDATLVRSLLAGASNPKVFLRR